MAKSGENVSKAAEVLRLLVDDQVDHQLPFGAIGHSILFDVDPLVVEKIQCPVEIFDHVNGRQINYTFGVNVLLAVGELLYLEPNVEKDLSEYSFVGRSQRG